MKSMKKSKLGLPLEYSKLSTYFDVLNPGSDVTKNRMIEKILKRHKVKTVLDLTCGTGSQVFWLKKCGYKVTGADLSPALIKLAKHKARKEKIKVKILRGDMRSLKVGHFDAVITIANAVGHLTKVDFAKTMQNINSNLKKGGLYIFDIFNLNAMTNKVVTNLAMDLKRNVNNTKVRLVQYSKLNKKNGRLTSYDKFTIQEDAKKPTILKGKFSLQIYAAKELTEMLIKNGFEIVGLYGLDGFKFSDKKTQSILMVARKRE